MGGDEGFESRSIYPLTNLSEIRSDSHTGAGGKLMRSRSYSLGGRAKTKI